MSRYKKPPKHHAVLVGGRIWRGDLIYKNGRWLTASNRDVDNLAEFYTSVARGLKYYANNPKR